VTTQHQDDARLRLFVAIELPDAWKEAVAAYQRRLQERISIDAPRVRLRYVRPEGVHLTLKFLGETPANRLPSIEGALSQAVTTAPNFRLELRRVGSFSDRRAARVVWAGVAGDTDALRLLAERVDTRLASAGFARERRGFMPHLTIARLPDAMSQAERELVVAASNAIALAPQDAMLVGYVSLMRSHLGPGGTRYERLARFPG
jgi:2'-5' RNA ligase